MSLRGHNRGVTPLPPDVEQRVSPSDAMPDRRTIIQRAESGQSLVLFALMATAMMAMLAIGIDLALVVGGQRRFDQNGADSAAIAAGRTLAGSVSPTSNGMFFAVDGGDEALYAAVRKYAGLPSGSVAAARASQWASVTPTGINQNIGLATRTRLAATLEYWGTKEWGATWCYSPTGPPPARTPAMPKCALYPLTVSGTTTLYPPIPADNLPFKLRVTVSSTAEGFFSKAIGLDTGAPPPPPLTDNRASACIRPHSGAKTGTAWAWTALNTTQAPGRTTCAHAVVAVSGAAAANQIAPVIPITTNDCRVTGVPGSLTPLWDSSPRGGCPGGPEPPMGSFKNMLDFSDEETWCDGSGGYNYSYAAQTPLEAACGGTADWNRDGYSPDPARPGGGSQMRDDIAYWIAKGGFGGTVRPDSVYRQSADGNWFPTCNGATPGQCGDLGNNIGAAFYCESSNSVTLSGNGCDSAEGDYFFALNDLLGAGATPRCPDVWGQPPYNYGCRDAGVLTWVDPQASNGSGWAYETSNPERLRGARILRFRLYCEYNGAYCTRPPAGASGSNAYGRFVSAVLPGAGTGGPVSLAGNYATFE